MLKWNQMQAIANKVAGREAFVVRPGDLEEPWLTVYRRVERLLDETPLSTADLLL